MLRSAAGLARPLVDAEWRLRAGNRLGLAVVGEARQERPDRSEADRVKTGPGYGPGVLPETDVARVTRWVAARSDDLPTHADDSYASSSKSIRWI